MCSSSSQPCLLFSSSSAILIVALSGWAEVTQAKRASSLLARSMRSLSKVAEQVVPVITSAPAIDWPSTRSRIAAAIRKEPV